MQCHIIRHVIFTCAQGESLCVVGAPIHSWNHGLCPSAKAGWCSRLGQSEGWQLAALLYTVVSSWVVCSMPSWDAALCPNCFAADSASGLAHESPDSSRVRVLYLHQGNSCLWHTEPKVRRKSPGILFGNGGGTMLVGRWRCRQQLCETLLVCSCKNK